MLITFLVSLAALILVSALLWSANYLSYRHLKEKTLRELDLGEGQALDLGTVEIPNEG